MLNTHTYSLAKKIVLVLQTEGFKAYFAGGWVRDWLLGHPSSDIDIATDAPLDKILDLFPSTQFKTHLVGLAFGVVIVVLEGHPFEIAIFRKDVSYTNGRKPDRIEPSNPEEDASRRDFTINGMFWDPVEEKIYDYVGGEADLKRGWIKTIGDPFERFQEDRLRMLRAVRFSARLSFHLHPETEEAIVKCAPLLFPSVARERVYQELSKMNQNPHFDHALIELFRLSLLQEIFPSLKGEHLNDFKQKVARLKQELPWIAFIQELLPEEHRLEEMQSLKISTKERELVEFLMKSKEKLKNPGRLTDAEWAYFYAHPSSEIALKLYSQNDKEHELRQQRLFLHIERLQSKSPLVTSEHIAKLGISPGPEMGRLIKAAEELAINLNLSHADEVMKQLKRESP